MSGKTQLEEILGTKDVPPYLTTSEAARILRLSPSTVRRKLQNEDYRKSLRAFKPNDSDGDWRFPSRIFELRLQSAEDTGAFA